MSAAPSSPLSSLRAPPTVLRPERVGDGWVVQLPWCMPRFLGLVVTMASLILGLAPVVGLQALEWSWADSLCVLVPMGLGGAALGIGLYYGARFALGRAFATRIELRPDGLRIDGDWLPAAELPEATQTHRVYRSAPNKGGSTSTRRVDWLHVGERKFACDVGGAAVAWLVEAVNQLRSQR